MQNVPENSAKTSLPWLHFKTDHALRREENKVKFVEGPFLDEKLPFLHKKKNEHSFEHSLSNLFSFNVVFLTLKCRTLVLIPPHGDRGAAILLKMDIRLHQGFQIWEKIIFTSIERELHISNPFEFLVAFDEGERLLFLHRTRGTNRSVCHAILLFRRHLGPAWHTLLRSRVFSFFRPGAGISFVTLVHR